MLDITGLSPPQIDPIALPFFLAGLVKGGTGIGLPTVAMGQIRKLKRNGRLVLRCVSDYSYKRPAKAEPMFVSNRIFAALDAAGDAHVCPESPGGPAAMNIRTAGQAALLFPFFWYVDFLSGGLFEKRTAEQMLHQQERIKQCFKSAFDAGSCGGWILGTLAVLSLGGILYTWVGKGSVLANWINLGLAASLALAMMRIGANSTFDVIVIAGWTVLAALGLIEASKSKGTGTPAV